MPTRNGKSRNFTKAESADMPRKLRVWKHNSFRGHASMMHMQLQGILRADSITPEARDVAEQMLTLVYSLAYHLEKRVDP